MAEDAVGVDKGNYLWSARTEHKGLCLHDFLGNIRCRHGLGNETCSFGIILDDVVTFCVDNRLRKDQVLTVCSGIGQSLMALILNHDCGKATGPRKNLGDLGTTVSDGAYQVLHLTLREGFRLRRVGGKKVITDAAKNEPGDHQGSGKSQRFQAHGYSSEKKAEKIGRRW